MHLLALILAAAVSLAPARPRIREAGITVGILPAGPMNAITDVPDVRVGHATVIRGENVRTGVTAILPHGGNLFRVQSNYGGILSINGAPIGRLLGKYYLKTELESADGSIMIVIATDAPVDARNLKRMGMRAMMGLARTGAAGNNGSGDYAIAFSTARNPAALVKNDDISPLFLAVIEATEEAIDNSLFKAVGVGGGVEALPVDRVLELLRK